MTTSVTVQQKNAEGQGCPIDHSKFGVAKTTSPEKSTDDRVEMTEPGVWYVGGYQAARTVLRAKTRQAGFHAEMVTGAPGMMKVPVLYMEGEAHHEQRRQTARFFTPRATEGYAAQMEAFAEQVIGRFRKRKRADLSDLSMEMSVDVAGQIIGLTNSLLPGMKNRLETFFSLNSITNLPKWTNRVLRFISHINVLLFFFLDVQPAINARKKQRRDDLISHLLDSDYNPSEIMGECVMYGAAGMVTTREFISVAVWHIMDQPETRQWYLAASKQDRYAYLHELLRLEPVVGQLQRIAEEEITLDVKGQAVTIPQGSRIFLNLYDVNYDKAVVGEAPSAVCPTRPLHDSKAQPMVMSFGDGHHRCAGAYVAIQETDIFLQKLLAIPTLQVEKYPHVGYSPIAVGYELRKFMLTA